MPTESEFRNQQKSAWDKFAPGWNRWDELLMRTFHPVAERLIDRAAVKPGTPTLDIATGTGEPGLSAARHAAPAKVTGVDLSPAMVAIANQRAKAAGLKNFEAVEGTETGLAFPDGSFDAVLCRFGLMFMPDPVAALKEMRRVLGKGGRVAAAVWAGTDANQWAAIPAQVVHHVLELPPPPPDAPGVFRHAAPGVLDKLLKDAGFEEVAVAAVDGIFENESAERHWEMIKEIAPPIVGALAKATEAQRAEVGRQVVERLRVFEARGGGIRLPFRAWVGTGVKP
jgi:ubiquinone/menaquinone biosynthesis C-methylase UbiE